MDVGIAIVIAAIVAVIGYVVKGKLDIRMREREQKEERYKGMLMSIKGFYESAQNQKLAKEKFIDEMNVAYLYASDEVIQAANKFLDTVKVKAKLSSDDDKRRTLAILIVAMRKDLRKTRLLESDFQTWISA